MRLSELRDRHQDRSTPQGQDAGTIRNSCALPKPIDALFDGQPVRIIATGDVAGLSPSVQIVDQNGRLDWVSSDDVTVTQRRFLPASNRAAIRQQSSQTRTRQSSSQPQYAGR